jgi:outer membrane biosynthesis protein TonB
MRGSLAASLGLHAAILVAALIVLPTSRQEAKPVEAITVDISNISDSNKLMAMSKDAPEPVEAPAPKKAEVVKKVDPTLKVAEQEKTAAKEAKAPPPPPPEPKPEVKKEEPKKEEPPPPDPNAMADLLKKTMEEPPPPKKEAPKKAEQKPEKKPDKQPEKKKAKALDVAALEEMLNNDALLNKENDQKTTNASEATADGAPTRGEKNLQGKDRSLSATTISAFVQRIRECWVIPPGAREGDITVKVRIQINKDGSIAGNPQVMNGPGDFLFETTARSTVAAILGCQNYDFLPQDQYDVWKDLVLNFNPNMFGDSPATQ